MSLEAMQVGSMVGKYVSGYLVRVVTIAWIVRVHLANLPL